MMKGSAFLSLLLLFLMVVNGEGFDELSVSEYHDLLSNKLIVKVHRVKGAPWPEVVCFSLVDASPEECAAVFSYYPHQVRFSYGIVQAKPVKQHSPTDVDVFFKMDMPWPVSNSVFITRNRLSPSSDGGYQIQWCLVKSDSSKENQGKAQFYPWRNKTLFRYQNFIRPFSILAKLFIGKMKRGVKKSVQAFVSYTELIKRDHPDVMQKYVTLMIRALSGEEIYECGLQKR